MGTDSIRDVTTEIEITPEMVEAGCRVLNDSGRLAFENAELDAELVREVLLRSLESWKISP